MPYTHPVLNYLRSLQPSESKIPIFLQAFNVSRELTNENFIEGVKKFVEIATLSPETRTDVYGGNLFGLYNNQQLCEQWNLTDHDQISPNDLDSLAAGEWEKVMDDNSMALLYTGQTPAEALDQLLQGPTVIDCGMFCQIGQWFGIRYLLGNFVFNDLFGNRPFYITPYNYETKPEKPHLDNPLAPFLTLFPERGSPALSIECVFNSKDYIFKHPAGHDRVQNCLVLNGHYYIFSSSLLKQGLTKSEVNELLLEAYNMDQTEDDHISMEQMGYNEDFFEAYYDCSLDSFLSDYEASAYITYTMEEFEAEQFAHRQKYIAKHPVLNGFLTFDIEKLQSFYHQKQLDNTRTTATDIPENYANNRNLTFTSAHVDASDVALHVEPNTNISPAGNI